jgi:hypothetical protein
MKKSKRIWGIAAGVVGALVLFAVPAPAQDRDEGAPIRLRTPIRFNPFGFGGGMTAVDPLSTDGKPNEDGSSDAPPMVVPEPRPSLIKIEPTANGTIHRFSDGSTIEFKPECRTETLCNGTKIETLPSDTKIVRWPNGGGVVRYPDGTGAEFRPDPTDRAKSGDPMPIPGTIEVLPGGVVRQTLKDDGVVLDRSPDGTIRSRPDLVKPEAKTMDQPVNKNVNVAPLNPSRPISVDKKSDKPKLLIPMMKPSIVK